jgi:hypothetical protein
VSKKKRDEGVFLTYENDRNFKRHQEKRTLSQDERRKAMDRLTSPKFKKDEFIGKK